MTTRTLNDWLCANNMANLRRGKITPTADPEKAHSQMWVALCEELSELKRASLTKPSEHLPRYTEAQEEAADMMIVLGSWLRREGVDVERLIEDKILYNINRED